MAFSYEEHSANYLRRQRESGFKVGDVVRVTRKPTDSDGVGYAAWAEGGEMDALIGKIGLITTESNIGFTVDIGDTNFIYPYFVLRLAYEDQNYPPGVSGSNFRKNGWS